MLRKALVASCAIGSADRSVESDGMKVRPAMQHTGKAPTPGVCELDHGDIDVALLEDAIFRQLPLDVVADLEGGIAERPDVVEELRRQVLVHASDPKIV